MMFQDCLAIVNMQTWGIKMIIAISGMQTTDNVALVNLRVWQTKKFSNKGLITLIRVNIFNSHSSEMSKH